MGKAAGTIRKLVLDGVTYDAKADIDITKMSKYEKEGIATTGQPIIKYTIRTQNMEGITVGATPAENEQLEALAARIGSFSLSVETADGSVYRNTGTINHENYTTQEATANIQIIPDGEWTLFQP